MKGETPRERQTAGAAAARAEAARKAAKEAATMRRGFKCRDYREVIQVLDARRRQLGLRMEDVDGKAGFQDNYAAKLFAGMRNLGPMSLPVLLETLGVEIMLSLNRLGLELLIVEKRGPRSEVERRAALEAAMVAKIDHQLAMLPEPEGSST
jgi:hypothetical protein